MPKTATILVPKGTQKNGSETNHECSQSYILCPTISLMLGNEHEQHVCENVYITPPPRPRDFLFSPLLNKLLSFLWQALTLLR